MADRSPGKLLANVALLVAAFATLVIVVPMLAFGAFLGFPFQDVDSPSPGPDYSGGVFFVVLALVVTWLAGRVALVGCRNLRARDDPHGAMLDLGTD